MNKINEFLKNNNIKPLRYLKKGNVYILEENNKKMVLKKSIENTLLYEYLNSRSFNYFPRIINEDKDYILMEYIQELDIPKEQKILDLVELVSLLHSKTTIYKETTKDDFKQIYEDIKGNIDYLKQYYDDIMDKIESKVYFSPSEYLLSRNISQVYKSLDFCENKIEEWYKLIENNNKQRYVLLHNNLSLDHFIENDKSYLISWYKSKIGLPIFDLYKLYRKHHYDFEFSVLLDKYIQNYPLKQEEKLLFFILISLPLVLELTDNEYKNTEAISKEIDRLFKSESLVSFYHINDDNNTNNDN